mmetsp:Transcript_12063/g.34871  ORF Transcript_12063/g.34871 Transcript_12063/m.34871 type:complete len:303 (+) Transcript_12063:561-1469(+)
MVVDELLDLLQHHRLHRLDPVHNVLLEGVLDALVGADHGHGVGVVGGSPAQGVRVEELLDVAPDSHHGHGHKRRSEPLCRGHNVGNNTLIVLVAPHLAGAPKADHDLVKDEENIILVAEGPDPLDVAWRVHEGAAGPNDGLQHDGGNGLGTLHENLLLEHGHCIGRDILMRAPHVKVERVRVEHFHVPGRSALAEPAPEVPCRREGRSGASVVRAVLGENLLLAGEPPGHADGRLVGLSATRGEEKPVNVARAELGEELGQAHSHFTVPESRVQEGDVLQLRLDPGFDLFRHGMAEIRAHCL